MAAGKHTLRSGKLHRRDKKTKLTTSFRPGDRFDATERELVAFGDCIVTWAGYLSLTGDKVMEVEGGDTKPTDKPKTKRRSRAKTAKKPEKEPEPKPDPEDEPESESESEPEGEPEPIE